MLKTILELTFPCPEELKGGPLTPLFPVTVAQVRVRRDRLSVCTVSQGAQLRAAGRRAARGGGTAARLS